MSISVISPNTHATSSSASEVSRRPARRFRTGLGLWRLYTVPKCFLADGARYGYGLAAQQEYGRLAMQRALAKLEPVKTDDTAEPLEVHFMTGLHHWYQTCFCAYTLTLRARARVRPVIHDDGTLTGEQVASIVRLLPEAEIVLPRDTEMRLDDYLPRGKFPYIRQTKFRFPLMHKLVGVHAAVPGWKLFLDSDMLFFRRPDFLLDWLRAPQAPCYMQDFQNAYGYTDGLLLSVLGGEMPIHVNTGVCGLMREEVDWEQTEAWCKALVEREGVNHFLEQTLTAMYFASRSCAVAPREDYIVLPERDEVLTPRAVMHHYVAKTRAFYHAYGWRRALITS